MRSTNHQTTPSVTRPPKMRFSPDRHYVMVEHSHGDWEGVQLDVLLDEWDEETNEPAYRIEADGQNPDQRRITHDRRKAILSCSNEYAARVARKTSEESRRNAALVDVATKVAPEGSNFEATITTGISVGDEIGLGQAIRADLAAQAAAEALRSQPMPEV
jgi:hypothetical protein